MYIFTYSHARFQVCAFLQLYGGSNKVQLFKTSAPCFSHGAFSPLWAKTGFEYFTVPASKGLLRKFGAMEVPESHTAHVEEGSAQVAFQFITNKEGATMEEDMKASQVFDVFLRSAALFVCSKQYPGHLAQLVAHPWQHQAPTFLNFF